MKRLMKNIVASVNKADLTESDTDNFSANSAFDEVLALHLSRRAMLKGSFSAAAALYFGGSAMMRSSFVNAQTVSSSLKLQFNAVAKNKEDKVTLPAGYSWSMLLATGDPLAENITPYANDGTDSANSFRLRAGDHNDGMQFFGMDKEGKWNPQSAQRGLLCINHEAITAAFLHPKGQTIAKGKRTSEAEVMKEMLAHGLSVVEVKRDGKTFSVVQNSPWNRRITSFTDMAISGPAARSPQLITKYSQTATRTRGTIANCANGHTPWGTYLTCEENWAGFFRRTPDDDTRRSTSELVALKRYGLNGNGKELWATVAPDTSENHFGRWHAAITGSSDDGSDDYRHAANTYGWVVEVDPFNPDSTPMKRTALGRFAHEGAWPGPVVAGRALVWYMGCDSRHEYIYKYVSTALWDPKDANRGIIAGNKYLNDGQLFVARFNPDGSGEWLKLSFGQNNITADSAPYNFKDQADVLIHARLAADAAGATKMDRPEWGAVNPHNGEVYMTLTNNQLRTIDKVDAANPRFYNDPKNGVVQKGNANGHIIRWAEHGGLADATSFLWDVFLFASRENADPDNLNLSALSSDNDFSSPDGLWFAKSGLLWIETDDNAYTDVSNCMLLAAIPGTVGDGQTKTIVNTDGDQISTVNTPVGAAPGEEGLRRFLVGPVDCEITGLAESPDGRALFVNIQHPGETTSGNNFSITDPATWLSHWPAGGATRPRSATIVITRDDGGLVGADLI